MDQRAGKIYRLTRRKDIENVFATGRSVRDSLLTILALPNGRAFARCGVGVSKRHGGAVRRNRVKRLCREAFRLSRQDVAPGWDYMIVPRVSSRLELPAIRDSIVSLARRLPAVGQKKEDGGG
jgi:ribonuclease P protein component